ncbi:hypothetical protein VQ643_14735 [Pseudomonas sp. F1_0610]|uniref:hypothetical protein n=1 Tax=Pseudomonas sp. F1_0610 TaxID=3114284 RepID=UPI0039C4AD66
MDRKFLLCILLSPILLVGCSPYLPSPYSLFQEVTAPSELIVEDSTYNPAKEARVRLYSSGAEIRYYAANSCSEWTDAFGKDRFNKGVYLSLPSTKHNISVGMPETEKSANALKNNTSTFSRVNFEEIIVPTDQLLVLDGFTSIPGINSHQWCRFSGAFTPKPGTDYEASFYLSGGHCAISIQKIAPDTKQLLEAEALKKCTSINQ